MGTRRHPPPPTKFMTGSVAQTKLSPFSPAAPRHAPPPTRYGAAPSAQAKPTPLKGASGTVPPPTRFGPTPQAVVQSKLPLNSSQMVRRPVVASRGTVQRSLISEPNTKDGVLIKRWSLEFVRENQYISVWQNPEFEQRLQQEPNYLGWESARYWYRAMPENEFEYLETNQTMSQDCFGGIASRAAYCVEYMGNQSPNRFLVEFVTPKTKDPNSGFLYLVFNPLGLSPKGEGGGGTIGLGNTGTGLGAKVSKEVNQRLKELPEDGNTVIKIFNNMLLDKTITYRLVRLHVPKT